MTWKGVSLVVVIAGTLLSAGCGGDDAGTPNSGGSGGTSGGSNCEGRGEAFTAGMTKTSSDGSIKVTLVRSDTVPPAQGPNTWTLGVTDASGQPITGASVAAGARMPGHPHDGNFLATEGDTGVYDVTPEFTMPGFWETEVKVLPAGSELASVTFGFCIPQD
jgi:hypothetical protein